MVLVGGACVVMLYRRRREALVTAALWDDMRPAEALTMAAGFFVGGVVMAFSDTAVWSKVVTLGSCAVLTVMLINRAAHAAASNAAVYADLRALADRVRNRTPALAGSKRPGDKWARALRGYGIDSIAFTCDGELAELILSDKAKHHAGQAADLLHVLSRDAAGGRL
ncbi:hypothetical protein H7I77_09985 [Mycolicibacterium novocastrense]|uniref:Uncharacterized protein n=1 Tax=Mycolicibacterium novocastrense TaxID=59813 RepID=A0AAW5SJC8_MYCNV|nr:hypothetical protein [Mycolicibacterium novocastrense]MCV7023675.1 hypothetical protein [Mycolicibacterium novocastrense]